MQSIQNQNDSHDENFRELVKSFMKEKNVMSQARLIELSNLSRAVINRILRDSNDRGDKYTPTRHTVMALCIGLKLTPKEADELFLAAFPEWRLWKSFLDKHLSIYEANEILESKGYKILGYSIE